MKIKIEKEVNIRTIIVSLPVNYEEEDIPNDFPGRCGKNWTAAIDVDTGRIRSWPFGKSGDLYMKVTDGGSYKLISDDGRLIAERNDYVPHGVIPGDYGDYVDLKINADGTITNWPKKMDFSAFFPED